MFKGSISQTPFTTEGADDCFPNITGQTFGHDNTFLATLRALLAPRMQDSERINLVFDSSYLTASHVRSRSASDVVSTICRNFTPLASGKIVIHNFRGSNEDNDACFSALEAGFTAEYDGYYRLTKLKDFYRKSFAADCYINPDKKSVVVFVSNLDNKKLHYLQVSILAMFPWYLSPEKGITEDEMALIYSLRETSPDRYNECIAKLAEQYDFKTARIRRLLDGFETRYEQLECDRVKNQIVSIDREINEYNERIGEYLKSRNDQCIRLMGLQEKIARGGDGDSEIMDYFIKNPNLVLESVSEDKMCFSVKGRLDYFDPDMAESVIMNEDSFAYRYGFASRGQNMKKAQRLLSEIFLKDNPRLFIRFCAAYKFNLNGRVGANGGHNFGYEFSGYMPNPHINEYNCMGDYTTTINEMLLRHDYIGAIEQCVASCQSLNWGDGVVMERFMQNFWDTEYAPKCVELPDGSVVTAKEAALWLDEQDKQSETEKEESQDEQDY